MATKQPTLNVFIAYAREDSEFRNEIEKHLASLIRNQKINIWYDGLIKPGQDWESEIEVNLEISDIIIFLISADFVSSQYCYEIELQKAYNKYLKNESLIIPIIVRPCIWKETLLSKFQVLPKNGEPIVSNRWQTKDFAYNNIAEKIHLLINKFNRKRIQKINHFKRLENDHVRKLEKIKSEITNKEKLLTNKLNQLKYIQKGLNKIQNSENRINQLSNEIETKNNEIEKLNKINRLNQLQLQYKQQELNTLQDSEDRINQLSNEIETKNNKIEKLSEDNDSHRVGCLSTWIFLSVWGTLYYYNLEGVQFFGVFHNFLLVVTLSFLFDIVKERKEKEKEKENENENDETIDNLFQTPKENK